MNEWKQGSSAPEIEKLINFIENFIKKVNGVQAPGKKKKNSAGGFGFMLPVLVVFALFGAFYTVQPDEEAVILRFGQYVKTSGPGLHLKVPFGIDKAQKVKTKLVLQEEFGFRTLNTEGKRTSYTGGDFDSESLMLTGDLNVADVQWIVQFQISDPKKYLFHTADPKSNIRDISEAVMRRVVGDRLVNDVLTTGRLEIAGEVKEITQELFEKLDMGIKVISVNLQDVNPPEEVKPSFNEVNAAKQEQEKEINNAEQQFNRVIPKAIGEADQSIAEAEGYAKEIINKSQGDAKRFNLQYSEYVKAPSITKKRLYIESMERVFSELKNVTIIDKEVKGVLPLYQQSTSKSSQITPVETR